MAAQHKHLVRMERLEKKAEPMIGELSREGRTVYYVFPAGGRYFESQNETECVDYLIRNKYVR